MKNFYFLCILVLSISFTACSDDETPIAIEDPGFSFTYDWSAYIQSGLEEHNLPSSFDVTWDPSDVLTKLELEDTDVIPEGAFYITDTELDASNVIIASDIVGQDTLSIVFQIFTETLEEKRYEFASADVLKAVLEGLFSEEPIEIDFEEDTIYPIIGGSSEDMSQLGALSFFAPSDYKDSYLEITNIDPETKEISGNFYIDWDVEAQEEEEEESHTENILKISNGVFSRVPFVQ